MSHQSVWNDLKWYICYMNMYYACVYTIYQTECCVRVYICAWCRLVQAPVRNLRHISHANADLLTRHRMGCWAGLHEVKCHWWGRGRRRAILTGNGWNRGKWDWCVGQEVQQCLFSVHLCLLVSSTHRSSQDPPALSRWNSFASNVSIPSDVRSGSPRQPSLPTDHLL